MTSSAAARPTSGCEPAPSPSVTCTPIWMMRSALDMVSACASVLATTKSTPDRPISIMLLTALPPAPPTPNTVMRGLSSRMSGTFRLIVIVLGLSFGAPPAPCSNSLFRTPAAVPPPVSVSETVLDPPPHPQEVAVRSRAEEDAPRLPRHEVLEPGHLGVDEQSHGRGEGRPSRRLG